METSFKLSRREKTDLILRYLCSLHRGHLLSRDTIRRGLYAYGISIYPIFLFVKPRIILAGYFLLDCACPACYNLRYKEVRKWLILKK